MLRKLGMAHGDVGSHSLKRTVLAWLAKAGVAPAALHGQLSQLTKRPLLCGCSGFQRAVHSYLARKGQVAKPCA